MSTSIGSIIAKRNFISKSFEDEDEIIILGKPPRVLPNSQELRNEIDRLNVVILKQRTDFKKAYMEMADGYSDHIIKAQHIEGQIKDSDTYCQRLQTKVNKLEHAKNASQRLLRHKDDKINFLHDRIYSLAHGDADGLENTETFSPSFKPNDRKITRKDLMPPQPSAGIPRRALRNWKNSSKPGSALNNIPILPPIERSNSLSSGSSSSTSPTKPFAFPLVNRKTWTVVKERPCSPQGKIDPQIASNKDNVLQPPVLLQQHEEQLRGLASQHLHNAQARNLLPRELSDKALQQEQSVCMIRFSLQIEEQQQLSADDSRNFDHHRSPLQLPQIQTTNENFIQLSSSQNVAIEMKDTETPKFRSRKRSKVSKMNTMIQQNSKKLGTTFHVPTPPKFERRQRH